MRYNVVQCGTMWYTLWYKVGTVCGTKSAGRKTAAMTVMVHCYCPTSRCNVNWREKRWSSKVFRWWCTNFWATSGFQSCALVVGEHLWVK